MKTVLKIMFALLVAAAAAFGIYYLSEKNSAEYVDIYSNYTGDED